MHPVWAGKPKARECTGMSRETGISSAFLTGGSYGVKTQSPLIPGPSSQAQSQKAGMIAPVAPSMTERSRTMAASIARDAGTAMCPPNEELLLDRIRGEYLEMPGLKLTLPQAERLWQLSERRCLELLGVLVDARFLYRKSDGRYARVTEAHVDSGVRVRGRRQIAGLWNRRDIAS